MGLKLSKASRGGHGAGHGAGKRGGHGGHGGAASAHGHKSAVLCVVASPDGEGYATSSWDTTAKVWDGVRGGVVQTLAKHVMPVMSVAYTADSQRIVTASWDKTACVWDAVTGEMEHVLKGHKAVLWGADFSPSGTHVVTASGDQTAKVWFIPKAERVQGQGNTAAGAPAGQQADSPGRWLQQHYKKEGVPEPFTDPALTNRNTE